MGVADGVGVRRVLGDEAGEAGPAAVDQIEPFVLAQRLMVVEAAHGLEEVADLGQVALADIAHDAHFDHR